MQTLNDVDPVITAIEQGHQQIRFYPTFPVGYVTPCFTLDEFILMANQDNIVPFGKEIFGVDTDSKPTIDPAQLVKINLLYHSLAQEGIVKPLLLEHSCGKFTPLTGDSRIRSLSMLPEIKNVPAFVTYYSSDSCLPGGVEIDCFEKFAHHCSSSTGDNFWFEFDDNNKLIRYETNKSTRIACAGFEFYQWCLSAIAGYMVAQTDNFLFDRQWFTQQIDWQKYVLEQ